MFGTADGGAQVSAKAKPDYTPSPTLNLAASINLYVLTAGQVYTVIMIIAKREKVGEYEIW